MNYHRKITPVKKGHLSQTNRKGIAVRRAGRFPRIMAMVENRLVWEHHIRVRATQALARPGVKPLLLEDD